jgi:hypothetical protein
VKLGWVGNDCHLTKVTVYLDSVPIHHRVGETRMVSPRACHAPRFAKHGANGGVDSGKWS